MNKLQIEKQKLLNRKSQIEKDLKFNLLGIIIGASIGVESKKRKRANAFVGGVLGLIASKLSLIFFPKTSLLIKKAL